MAAILTLGLVENILVGGQAVSILSKVGTDLVITTLTSTTGAVCGALSYIYTSDQPGLHKVKDELEKIDLDHTVEVIRALVSEHDKNEEMKDSVKKALLGVNEVLSKIHNELMEIKKSIEKHNGKYFSSWRSFDCKCNIKTIIRHKELLDKRYKMFLELLGIYN